MSRRRKNWWSVPFSPASTYSASSDLHGLAAASVAVDRQAGRSVTNKRPIRSASSGWLSTRSRAKRSAATSKAPKGIGRHRCHVADATERAGRHRVSDVRRLPALAPPWPLATNQAHGPIRCSLWCCATSRETSTSGDVGFASHRLVWALDFGTSASLDRGSVGHAGVKGRPMTIASNGASSTPSTPMIRLRLSS